MTIEVGILCEDGIVIGADGAATFSDTIIKTIEQKTKKIEIIEDFVVVAGTGQIGLGQRFVDIVKKEYSNKTFSQKSNIDVGRIIASAAIKDFISTNVPVKSFGALMAYATGGQLYLCEFSPVDMQPEWKNSSIWYVSIGCGQNIADPFLGFMRRVFWKDGPPKLAEAIWIVTWVLQHAIDLNPGGINGPIQIAVIRKKGDGKFKAEMLGDEELREHFNIVEGAERHLADYRNILIGKSGSCTSPSAPTEK